MLLGLGGNQGGGVCLFVCLLWGRALPGHGERAHHNAGHKWGRPAQNIRDLRHKCNRASTGHLAASVYPSEALTSNVTDRLHRNTSTSARHHGRQTAPRLVPAATTGSKRIKSTFTAWWWPSTPVCLTVLFLIWSASVLDSLIWNTTALQKRPCLIPGWKN